MAPCVACSSSLGRSVGCGEARGRCLWRAGDVDSQAKRAGQLKPTSYCLVDWLDTEGTIATALADATDAVSVLREEFRAINASGGHLDFFVGLFVDSTMGLALPPSLLMRLGEAGIALEFDIYGPPSKGSGAGWGTSRNDEERGNGDR